MKISEGDINYNAVSLIKDLVESRYDLIENNEQNQMQERGYLLMTIGEIAGIIEMADAMKEVLKE